MFTETAVKICSANSVRSLIVESDEGEIYVMKVDTRDDLLAKE
jgi:hypothetical protein